MKLSALAEALTIFARVSSDESFVAAEHDTIWVSDVPPARLTPSELARLHELGFTWENGCSWRHDV
jgi:hypothetical protein